MKVTLNKRKSNHKILKSKAFIPDTPSCKTNTHCKETSLIAYRYKLIKASLTVETALVLPIFLFALISLIYLGVVIQYTNCVEQAIHQTAKDMAVKSYVLSKSDAINSLKGKVSGVVLSETYVRSNVNDYLKDTLMKPGSIYYFRSDFEKNDIIDIVAEEKVSLPYSFLGLQDFFVLERARVHAWTGYDVENTGNREEHQEEVVYITKNGSVYHKSRNCIHLKITPQPTDFSQIDRVRNESGSKYYACEYCGSKANSGIVYITGYGNRYHTKINCGALSRDIDSILISKVGSRRACKDCS